MGNIRETLRHMEALSGPLPKFVIAEAFDNPIAQFADWLHSAIAAKVHEPHAMTLSTIDRDGSPDARVLLLKDLDQDGWHFAANATSPKGRQIADHAEVALTFYWPAVGRQTRIKGTAIDLGRQRSAEDFLARSQGSRAGALVGRQSEVLESPADLEADYREQLRRVMEQPSLVEPAWTAYAVRPSQVEFWQGSTDRQHQRLRFSRVGNGWTKQQLRS